MHEYLQGEVEGVSTVGDGLIRHRRKLSLQPGESNFKTTNSLQAHNSQPKNRWFPNNMAQETKERLLMFQNATDS